MEHLSTVTCFLVIARTGDKFWDKPGIDSSDSSRVQRQETWPHWALPGCFGFSTSKPYRPYLIFPVHSFSNLAEFRDRRFTTRNQPDWRSERSESSCSWLVNGLMFDKSLPTGDDSPWLQWLQYSFRAMAWNCSRKATYIGGCSFFFGWKGNFGIFDIFDVNPDYHYIGANPLKQPVISVIWCWQHRTKHW